MTPYRFPVGPAVASCPYCATGKPHVTIIHDLGYRGRRFATYNVSCCNGVILALGPVGDRLSNALIEKLYPPVRSVAVEVPEPAKTYLQQAFETLHAPDAAAVMAGSAVDAMLKYFKFTEGSVYARIDQAVAQHVLTQAMGDWAHEVRLGANRPRHADAENPHVTPAQASQAVEFAESLAYFLFVLSSRVARGVEKAKEAK